MKLYYRVKLPLLKILSTMKTLLLLSVLITLTNSAYCHTNASNPSSLYFVTEHSPPYQELNGQGQVEGIASEIVRSALERTPYKYDFNIYPWSRAFEMAKKRANTCIFLMSRNEEREALFQWVAPIVNTNDYFIGLSNRKDINVATIEDIKKYKVAVLKDDRTYHILLKHGFIENKNLYVINNTYSMLKLLITRKEIDFILADTINVEYRAKFNNIDPNLFRTYLKLNQQPIKLHLACSMQTAAVVIHTLKKAINEIKQDGTYDAILQKFQHE